MKSFRRLAISTLVAVYILIFVGGVVRSTGSGMGCPDWPRCFGQWVPPTSVDELPADYQEFYSAYRHKKNERFAKYLRAFGLGETADKILTDPAIREEAEFNPVKTWIEYVNRLAGVVIGLLIFAVLVASWKFRKSNRSLTIMALATFILVGFQGWLGSIVVSTNLTGWTITLHMFLALMIVAMLIWIVVKSTADPSPAPKGVSFLLLLTCSIVLLLQILWGTRVREAVDVVMHSLPRDGWISGLGKTFIVHRTFSWVVVLFYGGLTYNLIKTHGLKPFPLVLIMLILATILTGAGMAHFDIPAFLQPTHLLLASVAFGMQFMLMMELTRRAPRKGEL